MRGITFTPELLAKLKDAYQKAVDSDRDSFTFEGVLMDRGYSKYLIEYLEGQFSKGKK